MISQASQDNVSEELWKIWQVKSAKLRQRNGTVPNIPFGGHDIANNPALQNTIDSIAMIFLPTYVEKAHMIIDHTHNIRSLVQSGDATEEVINALNTAFEAKINGFDSKLIRLNGNALKMLLAKGSGLDAECARQSAAVEEKRSHIALSIMKPLIRDAIDTSLQYTGLVNMLSALPNAVEGKIEGFVPASFDGKNYIDLRK